MTEEIERIIEELSKKRQLNLESEACRKLLARSIVEALERYCEQ